MPLGAVTGEGWGLVVAAGIGILLGAERERHKGRGPDRGAAGVRTFALAALLGALAARLGSGALVAAVAFVGVAALLGYRRRGEDPGLTTEMALVVSVLLGALAVEDAQLAAGVGVGVALLLAGRGRLHRLVRDTLSEQELHDGLMFAAAALIVLPLVPDRGFGPHEALNPFTVWRLVVIVMAINGLGYVALRVLGPKRGLPPTGFIGGFVSSAATVGAMGARAKAAPAVLTPAVAAAVLSTVATPITTGPVVAAVSVASLVTSGRLEAEAAIVPVLVGLTTNTVTKAVLGAALGGRRYAWRVGVGLVLVIAAASVGGALAVA